MMCYNVAWMQSQDMIPNKEASITKAFGSETMQRLYVVAMQILGPFGQLEPDSKWAPFQGRIENAYMRSGGGTVAAGTSEIQRDLVAKEVGL